MQFNPAMFQQQAQNMNPDTLKSMTNMFSSMSDEQIKQYAQMGGMGNIDPNMLRASASMMKNMKNEDIKNMTNQAANKFANTPHQNTQPDQQTIKTAPSNNLPSDSFPQVNRHKTLGNEAFKKGQYDQASAHYLEAILDVEELWGQAYLINNTLKSQELVTLESQCRLNYCNVKAKQGDFDIVRVQAQMVLKKEENWKGYFRLGQAYLNLNQIELSITNLEKAQQMMPQDVTVNQLLKEAQSKMEAKEIKTLLVEPKQNDKSVVEQEPIEESKQVQQEKKQEQKPKKQQKLESVDVNSEDFQKLKQNLIKQNDATESPNVQQLKREERKQEQSAPPVIEGYQGPPKGSVPLIGSDEYQKGMEQFKNMVIYRSISQIQYKPPDQLEQMSNVMKNMDKGFLKSMMKQQTGVEMQDSDIERMQSMITPDMLSTMRNMDPKQIEELQRLKQQRPTNPILETQNSEFPQETTPEQQTNQFPQTPPSITSMMNSGMIQMVFQQLKQNPEILKSMVGMLGPNNPISGYIQRASPKDLSRLVWFITMIINMVLIAIKIHNQMKKYWLVIVSILLAYIIFR